MSSDSGPAVPNVTINMAAEPQSDQERKIADSAAKLLEKAPEHLTQLQEYKGCEKYIRTVRISFSLFSVIHFGRVGPFLIFLSSRLRTASHFVPILVPSNDSLCVSANLLSYFDIALLGRENFRCVSLPLHLCLSAWRLES